MSGVEQASARDGTGATDIAAAVTLQRPTPRRLRRLVLVVAYIALLLGIWWAIVRIGDIPIFLVPGPDVVAQAFVDNATFLAQDSMVTLFEALSGFAVALVAGVVLSALMVYSSLVRSAVLPLLSLLNALPKVALAPLLVIYLGLDIPSKVAMAVLICFFPIVINVYSGLNNVDVDELKLFKLLHASEFETFRKLRLPNAVPSLFDGMKVALPLSVIGAIVGEFVAADKGIGYEIDTASSHFNMALLFAAVVLIAVLTTILFQLLLVVEAHLLRWRPPQQSE